MVLKIMKGEIDVKNYLSDKIDKLPKEYGIFEIYDIAARKENLGQKVIHMEIGRPDFDTPYKIKEAAKKSLNEGFVHYTQLSGIDSLRQAIVDREKIKNGLEFDPQKEVLVTAGASEVLYCIWVVFLNSEDEILIPSPYYSSYGQQLLYAGTNAVKVPIMKEGKVEFDINEFKARLTKNTKMILINSPHNPTGYVMTEEEMKEIAQFAVDNDLIVVSDECYDSFVFEGTQRSIATFPGMKDRTLIVNSTSKTFSMTGWRIGYVLGNPLFIENLSKIHSHITVCATSFAQSGAALAFKDEDVFKDVDIMIGEFKKRRDYVANFLDEIDEINFIEPKGAFYVFMDVGKLNMTGLEFCKQLLIEKGVALAPGNAFGSEWKNYVRLAYTCSMKEIIEGMNLIKSFVEERNLAGKCLSI